MFILSADGRNDSQFQRYWNYLESVKSAFPPNAFALASSDWYWRPSDHRCPHDAWLESVTMNENSSGEREEKRSLSLTVRLLGAYHDGYIEIFYPHVHSYKFDVWNADNGHRDWRYDELRLSSNGNLLHEIEWCALNDTGRWIIEASDLEFRWLPKISIQPSN
ncbi:hypothetical protein [Rhizomicrobium electricum]|uniref:Uncharacterized protein n=1 Tax=Rhizomicrobium electricum TaxID=480070 RepID=A0ABP3PIH0_9PROT|nr:hypothetical protein [Rhizomicrobium electricum]NIJ48274.1 hypothetical protein [Rhizomicrobium electricum]